MFFLVLGELILDNALAYVAGKTKTKAHKWGKEEGERRINKRREKA